jgi:hypothetical protein
MSSAIWGHQAARNGSRSGDLRSRSTAGVGAGAEIRTAGDLGRRPDKEDAGLKRVPRHWNRFRMSARGPLDPRRMSTELKEITISPVPSDLISVLLNDLKRPFGISPNVNASRAPTAGRQRCPHGHDRIYHGNRMRSHVPPHLPTIIAPSLTITVRRSPTAILIVASASVAIAKDSSNPSPVSISTIVFRGPGTMAAIIPSIRLSPVANIVSPQILTAN